VISTSNAPPPTTSQTTIAGDTLSYSSYGVWTDTSTNPNGVSGVFSTGTKTPLNAMPRSGTASYVGGASALAITAGAAGTPLTGTFKATADFGNATVAGGMTMSQVGANGALTPYDSYSFNAGFALTDHVSGTAPIFIGAVTAANNKALTGNAQGTFFGPQGQEIGGTFALQGGGTSVIGAFGGTATTPPQPPAGLAGTLTATVDFSNRTAGGGMTAALSSASMSSATAFAPGASVFSGSSSRAGATGTAISGTTGGALFGAPAATTAGVFTAGGGTSAIGAFGGAKH
jgi:hypothetical protein